MRNIFRYLVIKKIPVTAFLFPNSDAFKLELRTKLRKFCWLRAFCSLCMGTNKLLDLPKLLISRKKNVFMTYKQV